MIAGMIAEVIAGVIVVKACPATIYGKKPQLRQVALRFLVENPKQNRTESPRIKKNRWAVSNLWNELCGV